MSEKLQRDERHTCVPHSPALDAVLVPCVLVGTYVGRRVTGRTDQKRLESLVLVFTALSTVPLLR